MSRDLIDLRTLWLKFREARWDAKDRADVCLKNNKISAANFWLTVESTWAGAMEMVRTSPIVYRKQEESEE